MGDHEIKRRPVNANSVMLELIEMRIRRSAKRLRIALAIVSTLLILSAAISAGIITRWVLP